MLYGLQDVSDNTRSASTCSFASFPCVMVHLPLPFNFHFEPLVNGISSTCFYHSSYLFIFVIFKFAVKMTKKKKGIFSYIRDCNVSFEEFLFISKFYSCCIVFYVCCSLLERNKILSIFRNFDFFR